MESNGKFFYLSDGGSRFGPFNHDEVMNLVSKSWVGVSDLIFDTREGTWTTIMVHPDFTNSDGQGFAPMIKGGLPPPPVKATLQNQSSKIPSPLAAPIDRWYTREGPFTLGPYTYLSILAMIQDKTLRPEDLVRKSDSKAWMTLSDTFTGADIDFANKISFEKVKWQSPKQVERRAEPRIDILRPIFVTSKDAQFLAQAIDLSKIALAFASAAPHFKATDQVLVQLALGSEYIEFEGEITRAQQTPSGASGMIVYRYLVQFKQRLQPEQFDKLEAYFN